MNIDITALDLLPETEPTALAGGPDEGLARCMVTCFFTCWDTCGNTEIYH